MYRLLYTETDDRHLKSLIEQYLPYFDEIEQFCRTMQMPNVTTDYDTIVRAISVLWGCATGTPFCSICATRAN